MGQHADALMMRSASRKFRKRLATSRSCTASTLLSVAWQPGQDTSQELEHIQVK